ncbi:bifunctional diguanylate cyclase/phosphodiesterase [Roseovarius nubinhibens]|uniref:EAL domain-containing protein n=1 Tax=Roseovarius nubinhibens TaxID=314263 RepID=UPI001C09A7CB|nr:bifunctional diguanylate cyclase/phosphodiesterase [Roseovarius nubinhibens]MBU2999004.1 bifunctional diguanylate cyclase/phosphodiesterase [Roseovarius nubinhibens]
MPLRLRDLIDDCYERLYPVLTGPPMLAFLPALVLAGYWLGGELVLVGLALGSPVILVLFGLLRPGDEDGLRTKRRLRNSDSFADMLGTMVQLAAQSSRHTCCLLIAPDEPEALRARLGETEFTTVMQQIHDRVASVVRGRDQVRRLGEDRIGVAMAPVHRLSHGNALHLANRLHAALEPHFPLGGGGQRIYVAIGLALASDVEDAGGRALLDAAEQALALARKHPPGALRIYAQRAPSAGRVDLPQLSDILAGLDRSEFTPWYQPQISTDTGRVSGIEALARWDRGKDTIMTPAGFVGALEKAGQIPRLDEQMQIRALAQWANWQASGLDIPQLTLNLSSQTLRQVDLAQQLEWTFDQFGVEPGQICFDLPYAIAAQTRATELITTLARLHQMGCQLDLDDFSATNFDTEHPFHEHITRLKLSANLTRNIARDTAAQRRLTDLIETCEPRGIEILAKGVETPEDHAILAQLGCRHIQGFVVSAPMAGPDCARWLAAHGTTRADLPDVGRLG